MASCDDLKTIEIEWKLQKGHGENVCTWNSMVDSVPSSMTSKKHSFAESGNSNVNSTP